MKNTPSKYILEGLSCSNCANRIERTLKDLNYSDVKLNFSTKTLTVNTDDVDELNAIISKIEDGIDIIPARTNNRPINKTKDKETILELVVSLTLLVSGIILTNLSEDVLVNLGLTFLLVAYLLAGYKVLRKAFILLRNKDFTNEYFLMTIATVGALIIGEVAEAVAVMVFYKFGNFLQEKAIDRSRQSISSLLEIRPDEAHLVKDGKTVTVPVEKVKPGDVILVKPGERVPLDGHLLTESAILDMSTLTGESRPIVLKKGQDIFSGSITTKSIKIKVTTTSKESTVSRILDAVENAAEKKSQTELFITRFARYYTPFVLIVAIFLAFIIPITFRQPFELWFYRALVILVISCPCALVVSIPLVYFSGIGKNSQRGILLKGADVIDKLQHISVVFWDKTGTLTEGKFKVTDIIPVSPYNSVDVIRHAAMAEAHSSHPIATSIKKAYGKEIDDSHVHSFEELPALGIKMKTKKNDLIIVGNDRMVHKMAVPHVKCIKDRTAVYVVKNGDLLGYIIIDDQIKKESFEAIKRLKKYVTRKIGLLTGDSKNVAERVGSDIGVDKNHIYSNLMPLNKLEIVENHINNETDKGSVVFVGDGINDAPVIARADIGVAMGGIGSQATIEAADLVLMDDNPLKLVEAIEIARKTSKIAKQNIVFAIGIKLLFIILGAMGLATMWAAVFGDVGVTILTVINSLRLLK